MAFRAHTRAVLCWNEMRVDPESTLGGYLVLQVRNLVRKLNNRLYWDSKTVQAVLRVGPREATGLVSALEASGLAKLRRGAGPRTWTTTQLAQSFGSATAAKPITRKLPKQHWPAYWNV